MRHGVDGRKFGRNTEQRKHLFRNLAISVIEKEQVVTTLAKAKEIRRVVDRLITLGKGGTLASRRIALARTGNNKNAVKKIFDVLAKRYESRPGGYTRIVKLSERRRGDAAEMAVLELVDHPDLSSRRKSKDAAPVAQASAEGEGDAPVATGADPIKKMKKLFSTKKKAAEI